MAEIKFRCVGRNRKFNEVIINSGLTTSKLLAGEVYSFLHASNRGEHGNCEFLAEDLFSGFYDKDGQELYENDIIQDIIVGMKSQIVFTDYGNFGLYPLAGAKGLKDLEYETIDPSWTTTSVIKIGNVYKNPELLK